MPRILAGRTLASHTSLLDTASGGAVEAEVTVESGEGRGQSLTLREGERATIGSAPQAQLCLPGLAPSHAALVLERGVLLGVDLGGGSLLGEGPLPRSPVPVRAGDALSVGRHRLRITLRGDDGRPLPNPGRRETDAARVLAPAGLYIERLLGEGAAGCVYAARRASDGRPVAVKVLKEAIVPGSTDHQRFLREGGVGARLRDPTIVEVLGLEVTDRATFIVMEWVEGASADVLVRERGPLPLPLALQIAEDVARALLVAASQGVVHRDIKPANVLVTPEGRAKLTDFGIAKDLDSTLQSLTVSGQGLGTLAYLPPEQVNEAKDVDPRADLYSLGATLYHLLAGRPPFEPADLPELFDMLEREPPSLAAARPELPAGVVQLVEDLMKKDPFERPASARRVGRAIRRLREGLAG